MAGIHRLRLCACLLNISEARSTSIVEQIASSALKVNNSRGETNRFDNKIKSAVLNIFQDYDYNRSVITIVSPAEYIGESVSDACCTAFDLIDLSGHAGGHPRLGSVDLVPIHPLSADISLEECGTIAQGIATRLTSTIPGTSAFLFGAADRPLLRGLVERRKAVKWFSGQQQSKYEGIKADVGPDPTPRYGLTGIGAIPYVMNCNVTIDTDDVSLGRQIAATIRASTPGGLPGLQAMAFAHEGKVEVACNVEAIHSPSGDLGTGAGEDLVSSFGHYYHVPPAVVERRVADLAARSGVQTVGTALVGFSPEQAHRLAKYALSEGHPDYWRQRTQRAM